MCSDWSLRPHIHRSFVSSFIQCRKVRINQLITSAFSFLHLISWYHTTFVFKAVSQVCTYVLCICKRKVLLSWLLTSFSKSLQRSDLVTSCNQSLSLDSLVQYFTKFSTRDIILFAWCIACVEPSNITLYNLNKVMVNPAVVLPYTVEQGSDWLNQIKRHLAECILSMDYGPGALYWTRQLGR
jgi:hypothetical protein